MNPQRIIGERTGSLPGPLMIVFAQIHGNEPAGYQAVHEFFKAVDNEYLKNPHFDFRGKIVAVQGNRRAVELGIRFQEKDLNRVWTKENADRVLNAPIETLQTEDLELRENLDCVRYYLHHYKPSRLVVLDLHTTSAQGGVFIIPAPNNLSRRIALQMHAPVLHGFLERLQGTTLHYFSKENFGIETASICFEAGQHLSKEAISHSVAAIISCFTAASGFYPEDIESKHEQLLLEDSDGLPREGKLIYIHSIAPEDTFQMRTDKIYNNFDWIDEGELLAYDKNGEIRAPFSGYILMPLYQKQGSDGFFIIQAEPEAGLINARQLMPELVG